MNGNVNVHVNTDAVADMKMLGFSLIRIMQIMMTSSSVLLFWYVLVVSFIILALFADKNIEKYLKPFPEQKNIAFSRIKIIL